MLAIHYYFALVPAPSIAPFFCLPTSHSVGFTPLTATYFTTSLKRVIVSLGMDPANYSPHSLRRGGATYAYHWSRCPWTINQASWISLNFLALQNSPTTQEIPIPSVAGEWIFSGTAHWIHTKQHAFGARLSLFNSILSFCVWCSSLEFWDMISQTLKSQARLKEIVCMFVCSLDCLPATKLGCQSIFH